MARAAQTAAQNANNQYSANATASLNNANASLAAGNDDISSLEQNDPYTAKSYLQNQNLLTSGAMNSANTTAASQSGRQAECESLASDAVMLEDNLALLGLGVCHILRVKELGVDGVMENAVVEIDPDRVVLGI
jgi:hypothetical protein